MKLRKSIFAGIVCAPVLVLLAAVVYMGDNSNVTIEEHPVIFA